ncbi:glycosyltransferase, partial [Subtercola sp. Z020]|uniref:glycosyltransferase n=1 Tax=Subtercola sp. Z020 TaxID=2080582 RepID=UPI0011B080BA
MSARRALVGWYLHHSGAGHRTRFDAVRRHLDADVVVFSTLAPPPALPSHTRWVMLDRDDQPERTESGVARDPAQSQPTAGGALHWAPLGHSGHASRLGMIAAALASERFDAFVVDVSVEVTLLVRLFGVPVVVMTQPGERNDDPHRLAFTAASRIVAPWPEALYVPRALEPFRAKTSFVGGISRFAGRRAAPSAAAAAPGATPTAVAAPATVTSVLVLGAGGGRTVTPADIEAAAVATVARPVAGWAEHAAAGGAVDGDAVDGGATVAAAGATTWHALGMEPTAHVSAERWNADPFDLLQDVDVVVSFAGQNAVADLASAGARAIVIAQPRAFDEQRATARVLREHGLAVVRTSWPAPDEWPALLAEARALTPDWSAWRTPGAASRAAAAIADVATLSAPSAQPTQTTPAPPPA